MTPVSGRVEYPDAGIEDSCNETSTTAKEIAEDLVGWVNNELPRCDAMPGVPAFLGVWWEDSPEPKLLKEKVEAMKAYAKALVAQADMLADTPETRKNITSLMRAAARQIGVKRPWLYESEEMTMCPACGSPVLPGVAVCKTCSAVIDEAKARKYFPERFMVKPGQSFTMDDTPEVENDPRNPGGQRLVKK